MADEPDIKLGYSSGHDDCGDCGEVTVELPTPLPPIGDDFDWDVRDYDGYRLFMLEELSARFPERRDWTPADMEVVLVEALAVVLDQLSDMNDRIQAESFLQTARRPQTVRRLLQLIGYDPLDYTDLKQLEKVGYKPSNDVKDPDTEKKEQTRRLEELWSLYPHIMDQAKVDGPKSIHQQHRMVTLEDYQQQLKEHPLVLDVDAYSRWSGAWYTHYVVVRLIENLSLDDVLSKDNIVPTAVDKDEAFEKFAAELDDYYQLQALGNTPEVVGRNARFLLQHVINKQRMIGQEVILQNATLVGIVLSLSIRIKGDYYRSEINDAVREALIDPSDGLFAPGRMRFGEDVVASNIIEVLSDLDGVESICINRMKRISAIYSDQSAGGRIVLEGHEVAVLEDDFSVPLRGRLAIKLHGGNPG